MSHIFLSYNHNDHVFALKTMKPQLEDAEFEVWTDDDIKAGTAWREEIDNKIRSAIALVVIMSSDARDSEYVTYEWACAWGAHIPVIPILHRPTSMHPRLESLQYLDFTLREPPWDRLLERLQEIRKTASVIRSASIGTVSQEINYFDLIERLESEDEVVQFYAIEEFAAIGEPVLKLLHYLLQSSSWRRRRMVLNVLREIKSSASIHALNRLVNTEEVGGELWSEALEILKDIGTPDAITIVAIAYKQQENASQLDDLPF
jgi:hypothetical protein